MVEKSKVASDIATTPDADDLKKSQPPANYRPKQPKYIGAIRCFYLTQTARYPHLSVGPTWGYTIGLFGFVAFCIAYFVFILKMVKNLSPAWHYCGWATIAIEIILLLTTFLKNPGIPKEIIAKKRHELENPEVGFSEGSDPTNVVAEFSCSDEEEEEDD